MNHIQKTNRPLPLKRHTPHVLGIFRRKEGQLVFFYTIYPFVLSAVLISNKKSKDILWRSSCPLWQIKERIKPTNISLERQTVCLQYIHREQPKEIEFTLQEVFEYSQKKLVPTVFDRVPKNPILTPASNNHWESLAVFNCAAIYLAGRVHLLYRAIGESGLSNFGYASSHNGVTIDERLNEPIYIDSTSLKSETNTPLSFSQQYQSGINWGGYEDPRLTQIGDTIYMTYTAFDGVNPPGVALTSISTKDFLNKIWSWRKPTLISAPQQTHKNWVIFPQKINGKFAILHSLTPEVRIDYYDHLNFEEEDFITSHYHSSGRANEWDNWMRGVGPPPLKTKQGWLVLYHAMDKRDPDRYKIGAMLLDLKEPTKIIYRSPNPLLEPDARYENDGFKSGVVYTCGAVIIKDLLYVYYGGADTVVCAAFIKLDRLLFDLKNSRRPTLYNQFSVRRNPKRVKLCLR